MTRRIPLMGFLIFFLALTARYLYDILLKSHYFFYGHPSSDVTYYAQWAQEILLGQTPADVFWGLPFYPHFLACLKILSAGSPEILKLFHLTLGAFNCVLVYVIGRNVFTENTGRLAGILCALNFNLIHYDWLMLPVTPVITISLFILLILEQLRQKESPKDWCLLGVLVGIGSLADGKFLILAAILSFLQLGRTPGPWLRQGPKVLAFLIGVALILSMVMARNKLVGGDWILTTAQSGLSLWAGNNPHATGFFENPEFIRPSHEGQDTDQRIYAENVLQRPLRPSEVSQFFQQQAGEFIKNNPGAYLKLLGRKTAAFFSENEAAYDLDLIFQREWKNRFDFNAFAVMVPLALLGLVLTRENPFTQNALAFCGSQLLFTLIFFLTHRHRTGILPILILLEAYTLNWFWNQLTAALRKRGHVRNLLTGLVWTGSLFLLLSPIKLPNNSISFLRHSKAGSIFEIREEWLNAEAAYLAALTINPVDVNTLCNLGNVYLKQGDLPKAIDSYIQVLNIAPFHIDALYNLAFSQEQLHNYPAAISLFEQVLRLSPFSFDALFRLGQIHQAQGDCGRAQEYYQQVLKQKPILTKMIHQTLQTCATKIPSNPK